MKVHIQIVKLRNKNTGEAEQWRLAPGRLISVSVSRDKDMSHLFTQNSGSDGDIHTSTKKTTWLLQTA